ncbi:MAG: hypothetical protein IJ281_04560 [Clostridia bacterium]|nr:hypothetical protein [Clostridia bacterium]
MTAKKFLAGMLAVCGMLTFACPVRAQDTNEHNVLFGAQITYVGLGAPDYNNEVYQDIYNLVDNDWAIGPESQYGNYHARITSGRSERYDIDGKLSGKGIYAAIITFELETPAQAAGFRLIHPDVTGAAGVDNPYDFLLTDFDVLGSESGQPGTWKVLYEARSLRSGSDLEYAYYESDTATGIPYFTFEEKFAEETQVSHVALAIHGLNVENNRFGEWMNIHEFQVFTQARYRESEVTEPVETTASRKPLTVDQFIPKSPLGMVAVSAVLATACSVGCLFFSRKKEQSVE